MTLPAGDRFRLLFVCTGNICRSAAAEQLALAHFARALGPDAAVDVASAGTHALVGAPMDPLAADALRAFGGDAAGFTARQLVAEQLGSADLVLTATRAHRAEVVRLEPRLLRSAFTLREFGRLAPAVDRGALPRRAGPVGRLRAAVDEAASLRGSIPPVAPPDDDVADPYRAGADVHARTVALLRESLQGPLDLLTYAYTRGRGAA